MTATMPEFLAFKDEDERNFFLAQGAVICAISELTRFPKKSVRAERKYAAQSKCLRYGNSVGLRH
jgi:hypothetical protein